MSAPLSDAIQEYLDSRKGRGIKPGTIRNERTVLNQLLGAVGNILVKNLTGRHIDMYFAAHSNLAPGTWNRNIGYMSSFFKWCRSRKHASRDFDPLEGITLRKNVARDFLFLPPEKFGELLDASHTPRDRAFIAVGLYTFQRASEILNLRWVDVEDSSDRPEDWRIAVYRRKTEDRDWLPLSLELKQELARWRLEYGRLAGELPHPDWFVVPAYHHGTWGQDPTNRQLVRLSPLRLNPTKQIHRPQKIVHLALAGIGYAGLRHEGAHTLRRSGGLALYQELAWNRGHDGALRIVQSMYGHKNLATTEHYLRLTLERKRRNDLLAGTTMFPTRGAEVVQLGTSRNEGVVGA